MPGSTLLTAAPRRSRNRRQTAGPKRIMTWLPAGIFCRELRAGMTTVAALAIIIAAAGGLEFLGNSYPQVRRTIWLPTAADIENIWEIMLIAVFFLMGILCGAEEEENGTADFARRLPVSRLHIYLAKIAGALGGVALWVAVTLVALNVIHGLEWTRYPALIPAHVQAALDHQQIAPWRLWAGFLPANDQWLSLLSWGFLFFSFAQAAGVWIRRVIVGALVGGTAAVIYGWVALGFATDFQTRNLHHWPLAPFLAASIVMLALALIRFLTREGR